MKLSPALALALLAAAIPLVQVRVDGSREQRARREVLYVGDGARLRKMLPGFEILGADLYWLRSVQYHGGKLLFEQAPEFGLLFPLLDLTTTLDPRLEVAYRYGAIFLCEPRPRGAGDCQTGLRLLAKGAHALPRAWGIRQDMGYFRFVYLGDADGAARELRAASRLPGAPFTLSTLAGRLLAKSGRRAMAREIWQNLYEQYPEGYLRDVALVGLQRIDGEVQLERLADWALRRREAGLDVPRTVEGLVRLGLDRRLLADPSGVPFAWDEEQQAFWFSRASRLWEPRRSY